MFESIRNWFNKKQEKEETDNRIAYLATTFKTVMNSTQLVSYSKQGSYYILQRTGVARISVLFKHDYPEESRFILYEVDINLISRRANIKHVLYFNETGEYGTDLVVSDISKNTNGWFKPYNSNTWEGLMDALTEREGIHDK